VLLRLALAGGGGQTPAGSTASTNTGREVISGISAFMGRYSVSTGTTGVGNGADAWICGLGVGWAGSRGGLT
jgi:hypothetical protein